MFVYMLDAVVVTIPVPCICFVPSLGLGRRQFVSHVPCAPDGVCTAFSAEGLWCLRRKAVHARLPFCTSHISRNRATVVTLRFSSQGL